MQGPRKAEVPSGPLCAPRQKTWPSTRKALPATRRCSRSRRLTSRDSLAQERSLIQRACISATYLTDPCTAEAL